MNPKQFNQMMLRTARLFLLLALLAIASTVSRAHAANVSPILNQQAMPTSLTRAAVRTTITWRGDGGDQNWSNPANWEDGIVPGPFDIARFASASADARIDPAFRSSVAGILLEQDYAGTLRLARDITISGDLIIAGGTFEQGEHALVAVGLVQSGGTLAGGDAPLTLADAVRVSGGVLTTPRATMRANSLDIQSPGIVRLGTNGKLNLAGDETPLTGNGMLDTTTYLPNSVEYTGNATTSLTEAGPATAFRARELNDTRRDQEQPRRLNRANKNLTPDPSAPNLSRSGSLPLNPGEDFLASAVIDLAAGFAYFGTASGVPGIIVKVRLSDFTRVGALTLNSTEYDLASAVIDPAAGFAYFGGRSWSWDTGMAGSVMKVRLSDFTRVGVLTFNAGENFLYSAVIDAAAGFAYFGTNTSPGIVVKVRLSDFSRVSALTLSPGENLLTSAVIDPAAGFAYFGTNTSPGIVVKVRLSDFIRVNALTFNVGEKSLYSAVIDPAAGFAYFGTDSATATLPGIVVKVRLSDFTRVGAFELYCPATSFTSAVIDPAAGFAYFGAPTWPGTVVEVRLSDFTLVDTLVLNAGETGLYSAVIDPTAGFAYFGTGASPGIVVKVKIDKSTKSFPIRE